MQMALLQRNFIPSAARRRLGPRGVWHPSQGPPRRLPGGVLHINLQVLPPTSPRERGSSFLYWTVEIEYSNEIDPSLAADRRATGNALCGDLSF